MKSIIYDLLELDDLKIKFYEKSNDDGSKKCLTKNKLSLCEWKSLIFGTYETGKFDYRKQIILEGTTNDELEVGDTIIIKDGPKRKLGIGTIKVKTKNNDRYRITLEKLKVFVDNIFQDDIIHLFKPEKKMKNDDIEIYINGLFKITYYSIINYFKYFYCSIDNDFETPENKFSAYCSYEAIKYVLKDYNISQLDSFIEGYKCEYDALILKKEVDNNKRLYKKEEVLSTIEIKTSGYFCSTKNGENIETQFKKYMDIEMMEGIPHIYLAIHEAMANYKEIYSAIKEINKENLKLIPVFCKIQKKSDYITIPDEFNLQELFTL